MIKALFSLSNILFVNFYTSADIILIFVLVFSFNETGKMPMANYVIKYNY